MASVIHVCSRKEERKGRKDWERKAGKGGGKNETERERKREPGGEAREPGGGEGRSDPRGPHVQKSQGR